MMRQSEMSEHVQATHRFGQALLQLTQDETTATVLL